MAPDEDAGRMWRSVPKDFRLSVNHRACGLKTGRGLRVTFFENLWRRLAGSKCYREAFVEAQVKRGIPAQIRALMKTHDLNQEQLAERARLSQGVISRAADLDYGNLTLNTIIRVAAGFDVAFVGKFVPFGELVNYFDNSSEDALSAVQTFAEEDKVRSDVAALTRTQDV